MLAITSYRSDEDNAAVNYTGIALVLVQWREFGVQLLPVELELKMQSRRVFRPTSIAVRVWCRGRASMRFFCHLASHLSHQIVRGPAALAMRTAATGLFRTATVS
ncbi:MAG: hypothetical protein CL724_08255 [Chloroflexi bacterium]|nr:hypothetical protein [Chloroflexota bacterium]